MKQLKKERTSIFFCKKLKNPNIDIKKRFIEVEPLLSPAEQSRQTSLHAVVLTSHAEYSTASAHKHRHHPSPLSYAVTTFPAGYSTIEDHPLAFHYVHLDCSSCLLSQPLMKQEEEEEEETIRGESERR